MTAFSKTRLVAALALGATALVASPVLAQQTFTNQLIMQAEVQGSCSIEGATLDFGTYTRNQTQPLEEATTISFTDCPEGSRVTLDAGGASSHFERRMTNGNGQVLNYNLYTDATRQTIWPTAPAAAPQIDATGQMAVYGRIHAGQASTAGSYSNNVIITVTLE